MKIEADIVEEISKRIHSESEKVELIKLVEKLSEMNLNVGLNQLLRCMLRLSNFQLNQFKEIIDSKFNGDPRDVIMEAQTKFKNTNYGISKFE